MRGLSTLGPSFSNTMYAVIATGGKQYRVTKDGVLRVEKLDAVPGATVEFGEVLLVGEGADVKLGKPTLKGGKVLATVVRHGKSAKRSEEHTSELQSRLHLVCRLLLEKKKKK